VEPASQVNWGQSSVPLTAGASWGSSTQDAFASFADSALAAAHFTTGTTVWSRSTYSLHAQAGSPALLIQDSIQGAAGPMVSQLNLMAQGVVQTPAGPITPPAVAAGASQAPLGQVFTLQPGVNRLGFTGQWGVDFDVYVVSSVAQQAAIGSWADNWTNAVEASAFKAATGQAYQESQYVRRVGGSGPLPTQGGP